MSGFNTADMTHPFSDAELEAYLDEALAPADMIAIEHAIRTRPELVEQLAILNSRRNSGVHTLGEIWRRHRLSCPSREDIRDYLAGTLPTDAADYLRFHVDTVGCRFCQANLEDLRQQQIPSSGAPASATRRSKIAKKGSRLMRGEPD